MSAFAPPIDQRFCPRCGNALLEGEQDSDDGNRQNGDRLRSFVHTLLDREALCRTLIRAVEQRQNTEIHAAFSKEVVELTDVICRVLGEHADAMQRHASAEQAIDVGSNGRLRRLPRNVQAHAGALVKGDGEVNPIGSEQVQLALRNREQVRLQAELVVIGLRARDLPEDLQDLLQVSLGQHERLSTMKDDERAYARSPLEG
ncbi:MAG: hypothetical protein ABI895_28545 [Deltaproteobacteria bacterium]